MKIQSKHTGSEVSIFSQMTAFAQKHDAVNLSQGFPDFEIDEKLKKFIAQAADQNYNQYAPLQGNPQLLENLVTFNRNRKIPIEISTSELTIVPGATYGIYCALTTITEPGDEIIVLEPCYDCYAPAIEMNGGTPVYVPLNEEFKINWELLENAITEKTKAIFLNSPHNPTGQMLEKEEIEKLWQLIKDRDIFIISDEVYDLLVYDDHEFHSVYSHPELKKRAFCIFSFGKMFHLTGWKIAYVMASEEWSVAFRRNHQYMAFCVNSVGQKALADYLEIFDVAKNTVQMQQRRDLFCDLIRETPFIITEKAKGGYFQIADFRKIQPTMSDKEFSFWLAEFKKVAVIPISSLFHDGKDTGFVRFCFAKKEETVVKAMENLRLLL